MYSHRTTERGDHMREIQFLVNELIPFTAGWFGEEDDQGNVDFLAYGLRVENEDGLVDYDDEAKVKNRNGWKEGNGWEPGELDGDN